MIVTEPWKILWYSFVLKYLHKECFRSQINSQVMKWWGRFLSCGKRRGFGCAARFFRGIVFLWSIPILSFFYLVEEGNTEASVPTVGAWPPRSNPRSTRLENVTEELKYNSKKCNVNVMNQNKCCFIYSLFHYWLYCTLHLHTTVSNKVESTR